MLIVDAVVVVADVDEVDELLVEFETPARAAAVLYVEAEDDDDDEQVNGEVEFVITAAVDAFASVDVNVVAEALLVSFRLFDAAEAPS